MILDYLTLKKKKEGEREKKTNRVINIALLDIKILFFLDNVSISNDQPRSLKGQNWHLLLLDFFPLQCYLA